MISSGINYQHNSFPGVNAYSMMSANCDSSDPTPKAIAKPSAWLITRSPSAGAPSSGCQVSGPGLLNRICHLLLFPEPEGTPVCGLNDITCYTAAQDELYAILQNQTMAKSVNDNAEIMCNCLPACTSLEYNFEISRAKYDVAKTIRAFREEYEHTE